MAGNRGEPGDSAGNNEAVIDVTGMTAGEAYARAALLWGSTLWGSTMKFKDVVVNREERFSTMSRFRSVAAWSIAKEYEIDQPAFERYRGSP